MTPSEGAISPQQILLALAENPALSTTHVDALITTDDPEILRALAREQSLTPAHTDRLAAHGDHAVLLELIRSGNLPLERISPEDPQALLAAVGRPDAPKEWLERLTSRPEPEIRRALYAHTSERPDMVRVLADDRDCSVAALAAGAYELPEETAYRLAGRTEACIRIALASNVRAPGEVLAALIDITGHPPTSPCPHQPNIETAHRATLLHAVANHSTPTAAVEPLTIKLDPLHEPDLALAQALAGRTDLRAETYESLAALSDDETTGRLAINRATPADLLRQLFDTRGHWRTLVLANVCAPLDLLIRHTREGGDPATTLNLDLDGIRVLATDPDPKGRLVAAASFRLPDDLRATLIADSDYAVARRAVCHHSVPAGLIREIADRYGPRMFDTLAPHPNCPPDVLLTIATHPGSSPEARIDVAWQEASPPAALEACLRHPETIAYLAGNPSTQPDILIELASHTDPEVVLELARNPVLPETAADRILELYAVSHDPRGA